MKLIICLSLILLSCFNLSYSKTENTLTRKLKEKKSKAVVELKLTAAETETFKTNLDSITTTALSKVAKTTKTVASKNTSIDGNQIWSGKGGTFKYSNTIDYFTPTVSVSKKEYSATCPSNETKQYKIINTITETDNVQVYIEWTGSALQSDYKYTVVGKRTVTYKYSISKTLDSTGKITWGQTLTDISATYAWSSCKFTQTWNSGDCGDDKTNIQNYASTAINDTNSDSTISNYFNNYAISSK
jgi:hypothetical protein